jgi:hypothetical protein
MATIEIADLFVTAGGNPVGDDWCLAGESISPVTGETTLVIGPFEVLTCHRCGSLVPMGHTYRHLDWHRALEG